jgi:DNA-directed RNA polymerase subunit M/transcription elongation factor TFIIS
MYVIENPETFRQNVRAKLSLVIHDDVITTNIEKGVYNYAIKEANSKKIIKKWNNPYFSQIYVDRLRTLYVNLKNPDLLQQVLNKSITPQTLVFMTHQEMKPERWSDLIEQKIKRDASKYATNVQASTDMFTCKKCKGKRTTFYELQTRSADEPATIFVTCLDCGQNMKK